MALLTPMGPPHGSAGQLMQAGCHWGPVALLAFRLPGASGPAGACPLQVVAHRASGSATQVPVQPLCASHLLESRRPHPHCCPPLTLARSGFASSSRGFACLLYCSEQLSSSTRFSHPADPLTPCLPSSLVPYSKWDPSPAHLLQMWLPPPPPLSLSPEPALWFYGVHL